MTQQGAPPTSAAVSCDTPWASSALAIIATAGMIDTSLAGGNHGQDGSAGPTAAAGGSPSQSTAPSKTTRRSCFRGLSWKDGRWRVRINVMGKQHHVGRYYSEIEAARAFDRAALCIYGDRALTNFGLAAAAADPTPVSAHLRMLALEKQKMELLQAAKAQQQQQQQAAAGAYLTPEGILVAPPGAASGMGVVGAPAFALPPQQPTGGGGESTLTHMAAAAGHRTMPPLGGALPGYAQQVGSNLQFSSPEHVLYQVQTMQPQQQQQQLLYGYSHASLLAPQQQPGQPQQQQQQAWMQPSDQSALMYLSSYHQGGSSGGTSSSMSGGGGVAAAAAAQAGMTCPTAPVYHQPGPAQSSPFAMQLSVGYAGPGVQAQALTGLFTAPGAGAPAAPASPGLVTASRYPSHNSSSGGGSSSSIYTPQQLLTGSPGIQQVQLSNYSFSSTASNTSHSCSWPQMVQQQGGQAIMAGAAGRAGQEGGVLGHSAVPHAPTDAGVQSRLGPGAASQQQQQQQPPLAPAGPPGAAAAPGLQLQELAAALQHIKCSGMVNNDTSISDLLGSWAQQQQQQQQQQQAHMASLMSQGFPHSPAGGSGQL